MKKVLHRGFKPAKCKTALQMANSRLKILKNKKEIQIKQLRRELAQLLESGNTPTARIRVEHVVREEKTMAAYELIGIYCELIAVRLGVIESQKNCPIDLKEAVTSILFSSQRLSDVPELSEIVKQFTSKYGKDFATSAIQLRPDSGVSRLLVEKLSAKAPDGPTKVKILMEIAVEHNVTWEAQSFVEPDPRDKELLSGASSFQSASSINMDVRNSNMQQPPCVQAQDAVSVQSGSGERHHPPENSYAAGGISSSHSNTVTSGTADDYYHSNARPSRSGTDEGECRNPNHGYKKTPSYSKHKWETEFVDSTDAARAAAEAAERASFAARAAAELSSKERMTRQDSAESHRSYASGNIRNEPLNRRNKLNVQSEKISEDHFSPRRDNRTYYEDKDRTQQDRYDRAKESEISPVIHPSERHSLENLRSNDSFGKKSREKQPSLDETDLNVGYSEDAHLRKQSSWASSHSSNYSDEKVLTPDEIKSSNVMEENIFATEHDIQSQSSFKDIGSHDHGHDARDTSDDYSSFFDKPKFDVEDEYDPGVGYSLFDSKTPTFLPTPAGSQNYREDHSRSHGNHSSSSQVFQESPSSPLFDNVSTSPPASYYEPDPHAKFDNYDPHSDSEDDQPNSGKPPGRVDERVNLTYDQSQKYEVSDPVGHKFFPFGTEQCKDDSRTPEESDSEADAQTGLKFRPLVGGFRNKKTLPPYIVSPAKNEPLSKSEKEYNGTDGVAAHTMSTSSLSTKIPNNREMALSTTPPYPSSSDDDDSEIQLRGRRETKPQSSYRHSHVNHENLDDEEILTHSYDRSQKKTHQPAAGMRYHDRPNFKTPSSYEDEEEEVERDVQVNTKPAKLTGFSRRTKGQVNTHEKLSHPVKTKKTDHEFHDQPSSKSTPKHKAVTSSSVSQTVKLPDPETPSTERASHVHPNLPDCDDIFARLGALRNANSR